MCGVRMILRTIAVLIRRGVVVRPRCLETRWAFEHILTNRGRDFMQVSDRLGREMDVWVIPLDAPLPGAEDISRVLAPDECARAEHFLRPFDRQRWINGRLAVRRHLAAYLCCTPESIRLGTRGHGKPVIVDPGSPSLHFNVSHSQEVALLAVTAAGPVGVDVERIRPVADLPRIVTRFFSPSEQSCILQASAPELESRFFTCWTRKESVLKALGVGLSMALDTFDVSVLPDEPARVLSWRDTPEEAARWRLQDLKVGEGYVACVAQGSADLHVNLFTTEDSPPE